MGTNFRKQALPLDWPIGFRAALKFQITNFGVSNVSLGSEDDKLELTSGSSKALKLVEALQRRTFFLGASMKNNAVLKSHFLAPTAVCLIGKIETRSAH